MTDNVSEVDLMDALKFTLEDLDANRKGFLSDSQKLKLKPKNRYQTRKSLLVILPVVGILLIILSPLNGLTQLSNFMRWEYLLSATCIAVYFIVACIGSLLSLLNNSRGIQRDLHDGLACSITGHIEGELTTKNHMWLRSSLNSRSQGLMTDIPPMLYTPPITLNYDLNALSGFKPGETYRIYFAANSKNILSAELTNQPQSVK
jgi:hypothetical protein